MAFPGTGNKGVTSTEVCRTDARKTIAISSQDCNSNATGSSDFRGGQNGGKIGGSAGAMIRSLAVEL